MVSFLRLAVKILSPLPLLRRPADPLPVVSRVLPLKKKNPAAFLLSLIGIL